MRLRHLLATFVVGLLAIVAVPSSASADTYPPTGIQVVAGVVSPARVVDGGSVSFSGGGFAPGALLRLSVDGISRGTLQAGPSGAFVTRFVLRGVGSKVLAASGLQPGGRLQVVSGTATVLATAAAAPVTTGGGLPFTGAAHIATALLGGLLLVVLGAVVLMIARTRRSRPLA